MKLPPIKSRFGKSINKQPLLEEIPTTAKNGSFLLFNKFVKMEILPSWDVLINDFEYVARIPFSDHQGNLTYSEICLDILKNFSWDAFLTIIEKVYLAVTPQFQMVSEYESEMTISLNDAQKKFSEEFNTLFEEENLGYFFKDGYFSRKGRPQTQKNVVKMGAVLADSRLEAVRLHFSKSLNLFEQKNPDFENSIKECVCSLEAFLELKLGKEHNRELKKLSGKAIHPTIVEVVNKIIAFRGDSKGVAHSAINSLKVESAENELILNLVAGIITYLYDKINEEERVPF